MQMSTRRKDDFTTNLSVVAQISKRQDVCLVSLNPTTLGLSLAKVTSRQRFYCFFFYDYYDKIAAEGEGCKPDLNRQKFIVESELAILSILCKLIIIIS